MLAADRAPWSRSAILRSEGVEPVVFYANSNIHPAEEYARRLATLREWAADADVEVVEGAYDPELGRPLPAA